jgi:hypothetical protein
MNDDTRQCKGQAQQGQRVFTGYGMVDRYRDVLGVPPDGVSTLRVGGRWVVVILIPGLGSCFC